MNKIGNKYEINKKVIDIKEFLKLNTIELSEYLGINRTIVSHVLNERNKASNSFLQGICNAFPELGFDWLKDGYKIENERLIKLAERIKEEKHKRQLGIINRNNLGNNQSFPGPLFNMNSDKKIKKIVILYDDNTFSEFNPF